MRTKTTTVSTTKAAKLNFKPAPQATTTNANTSTKSGLTQAEFVKIHDNFSEEQKEIYRKLVDLNTEQAANELKAAYDFGSMVAEAAEAKEGSKYGKNFVAKLAKLLGHNSGFLYERKRFYEKLFAKQDFDKLAAIRMRSTNAPLTYSHVIAALDQDDTTFWKYINLAADQSMTVAQLKSVIRTNKGGRKVNETRGRQLKVPDTVDGQLNDIEEIIPRLTRRASAWSEEGSGILGLLDEVPRDKIGEKTVLRVETVKNELNKSKEALTRLVSQLEDFLVEFKKDDESKEEEAPVKKASSSKKSQDEGFSFKDNPSLRFFGFNGSSEN